MYWVQIFSWLFWNISDLKWFKKYRFRIRVKIFPLIFSNCTKGFFKQILEDQIAAKSKRFFCWMHRQFWVVQATDQSNFEGSYDQIKNEQSYFCRKEGTWIPISRIVCWLWTKPQRGNKVDVSSTFYWKYISNQLLKKLEEHKKINKQKVIFLKKGQSDWKKRNHYSLRFFLT